MKIFLNEDILRKIKLVTESKYLDFLGLGIVLFGSFYSGFFYKTIEVNIFNIHIDNYRVGVQSTIGVCFSIMVTRLVTRRNNLGNFIGIFTTISAFLVDYLMGIESAWLTYPISLAGNYYSYHKWSKQKEIVPIGIDRGFFINFIYGFSISLVLNYLGFTHFLSAPIKDIYLFITSVVIVGLTFGGQFNTAKRYKDNWFTWQIYNVIKFIQKLMILDIASILKYLFYFFNAILGWITWTYVKNQKESKIK